MVDIERVPPRFTTYLLSKPRPAIATYLQSLATAWKACEVRSTHQRKATEARR